MAFTGPEDFNDDYTGDSMVNFYEATFARADKCIGPAGTLYEICATGGNATVANVMAALSQLPQDVILRNAFYDECDEDPDVFITFWRAA
ncbi:hypothetical protein [Nonomuraea candida]|uniref:hypothetical protein n=1 Tax=Nonomuraea candida TaxID=359159 RepID=UPI0005BC7D0B|nr:hypothetical protein [Nonomuraea candida]